MKKGDMKMANIFQRMSGWWKTQVAEYRCQQAISAKAEMARRLIGRQEAEIARVNGDSRVPATHKAVVRLAARERLHSDATVNQYQELNGAARERIGELAEVSGDDERARNNKGKGIGAFFGRLLNGRRTERQRLQQAEAVLRYDGAGGFALNGEEQAALQNYRSALALERPAEKEAAEVAAVVGDRRPQRYRGISQAAGQIKQAANIDYADVMPGIYAQGTNGLGIEENGDGGLGGSIKTGKLIPGQGANPSDRDATYRLGWAGYALFRKTPDGLFQGVGGMTMEMMEGLDPATGRAIVGKFAQNTEIEGQKFGQITTAGVNACSVIMVKKGDQYAMLHLDAKHTEPGEAKDHILQQMRTMFGGAPGEIEIMESVRAPGGSEEQFCNDLETALQAGNQTVKVQRIDRSQGKVKNSNYTEHDPPGHLEIGLTSQDVVFGDCADIAETDAGQRLHVRPVEWRLGASQKAAEEIWSGSTNLMREMGSLDQEQKRADRVAEERRNYMRMANSGAFLPPNESSPGMQAATEVAAVERRMSEAAEANTRQIAVRAQVAIDVQEGRITMDQAEQRMRAYAESQRERAPQAASREARQTQAETRPQREETQSRQTRQAAQAETRPQREHMSQQELRAEVGRPERQPRQRTERAETQAEPQREHRAAGAARK
jgi:hypothetical protein